MLKVLLLPILIAFASNVAMAQAKADDIEQLVLQRKEAASLARNEQAVVRLEKEISEVRSRRGLSVNESDRTRLRAEEERLQGELALLREKVRASNAVIDRSRRAAVTAIPGTESVGVSRPAAGSIPNSGTIAAMNDREVCRSALSPMGSEWNLRIEFADYRLIAERRGYTAATCVALLGGTSSGQTGQPPVVSPFIAMNDRNVCRAALSTSGKGWNTEPAAREVRSVAEHRGYSATTCVALVAAPPIIEPPPPPPLSISFEALCRVALGDQPPSARAAWSQRPEHAAYVAMAQRQGYTPEMCLRLAAAALEQARALSRSR